MFQFLQDSAIVSFLAALLLFLVLDGVWFALSTVYPAMPHLRVGRVVRGGGVAWAALAFAHVTLVRSPWEGFLFGLLSYSVFNGTEYAINNNWSGKTAMYDTMWGTFTNTLVATVLAA